MIEWVSGDVRLICGDCRDVLPTLARADAIITDPVWPNSTPELAGADRPWQLFAEVANLFPDKAVRAVIQLGCNSDPRFLCAIPASMPFFRVCWLEYVRPHYRSRLMYTGDVAYAFGEPIASGPGQRVIPGRCICKDLRFHTARVPNGHPTPRQVEHVQWLVRWFAEGPVIDPFAGSCTTGVACVRRGLPFIGVEISEEFFEAGKARIERAQAEMALFEPPPKATQRMIGE